MANLGDCRFAPPRHRPQATCRPSLLNCALALQCHGTCTQSYHLDRKRRRDLLCARSCCATRPAVDRQISSLAGTVMHGYIPRSVYKMKAGIHPKYYETDIVCACGAVYHTRSTRRDIKIGICAACHPFFTGEQKFVDTAGRVEKFARRYGSTKAARAEKKA